jgi:hypothetical protein
MDKSAGSYNFQVITKAVPRDRASGYRLNTDNGVWEKFGDNDNYPDYILDLYRKSNKHNSIIQTKVNLALGSGLDYEPMQFRFEQMENGDLKKVPVKMSEAELKAEIEKAEAFFQRITIQHRDNFYSLFVHGGGYITTQRARFTDEAGKNVTSKIKKAVTQKFVNARRGVIDFLTMERDPEFNYYCLCFKDASKHNIVNFVNYTKNKKGNPVVKVPAYSRDKTTDKFQSLFWGVMDISRDVYPTPDYENKGSLNSIEADYHLSLFDLAESENGLEIGYIYKIFRKQYDDPEKEKDQREKEIKNLKANFKGTQNANSFAVEWFEPSEAFPNIKGNEIIEIPRHKDYNYIGEKRQSISREILSAHGMVVSELAGLQGFEAGGFSSQADKLQKAFMLFYIQRIATAQSIYTDQVLNQLLEDEGIRLTAKIKPHPLVDFMTKADLRSSAEGVTKMLEVIKLVADGTYTLDAAIALLVDRFSLSTEEATAQLGTITAKKPQPGKPSNP